MASNSQRLARRLSRFLLPVAQDFLSESSGNGQPISGSCHFLIDEQKNGRPKPQMVAMAREQRRWSTMGFREALPWDVGSGFSLFQLYLGCDDLVE